MDSKEIKHNLISLTEFFKERLENYSSRHRKLTVGQAYQMAVERSLRRLNQALARENLLQVSEELKNLKALKKAKKRVDTVAESCLEELEPISPVVPSTGDIAIPLYCVSSMFLHECYKYLTQRSATGKEKEEWMLAVTGLRINERVLTLEQRKEFKQKQSAVRAAADMEDMTKLLIEFSEYGQALHGIFHSHRFAGPLHPSAIDLKLQEILERVYPVVQAVFSEDGYIRFFALNRQFEVLVHGKEVQQKHGAFLYHLD